MRGFAFSLVLLFGSVGAISANALDLSQPLATVDTSSPRATTRSYQTVMSLLVDHFDARSRLAIPRDVRRTMLQILGMAGNCFDLSAMAQERADDTAEFAAASLQDILDRITMPRYEDIPGVEQVAELGLDRWTLPNTEISLSPVLEGPRKGEWLFTSDTVARLEEFRARIAHQPFRPDAVLGELGPLGGLFDYYRITPELNAKLLPLHLPALLPAWAIRIYWGQALWKWIAAVVVVFVGVAGFLLVLYLARARAPKLPNNLLSRSIWLLLPPISGGVIALTLDFLLDEEIALSGTLIGHLESVFWALALASAAWSVWVLGTIAGDIVIRFQGSSEHRIDTSLIRISSRIASVLVACIVIIVGVERYGVPVVPLFAGLGIGGLAVALAVRPTLENVIGGFVLFGDRPVRPGDVCRFAAQIGTVESIGLGSTRVRTLDDTVVTVPNAEFSQMHLENLSSRSRTLLRAKVGLRYETTPDQLRYVLVEARRMLVAHPKVAPDWLRVRFVDFGDYSLDVEIFVYSRTGD